MPNSEFSTSSSHKRYAPALSLRCRNNSMSAPQHQLHAGAKRLKLIADRMRRQCPAWFFSSRRGRWRQDVTVTLFHDVFMRGRMRQSLLSWFTMQLIGKMGIGKGTVFHKWNNYDLEGVISVCSLHLFTLRRRQSSEAAWQGWCHLSTSFAVDHLDSDDHSTLMPSQRNHCEEEPIPPWFGDVTWGWG